MEGYADYFSVQPFENLLFIRSFGYWDGRVAEAFRQELSHVIPAHYRKRNWGILHDGTGWKLGTPEIERVITGLMTARVTGTLTHHAYVAGASQMKLWQVGKITAPVTSFDHRLFDTVGEAKTWLASLGYARS